VPASAVDASETPSAPGSASTVDDGAKQPARRLAVPAARPALPTSPVGPPPSAPEKPAEPLAKTTEAGLLAQALSQLRQRNDPRAALATLERYSREFPHGVLESEALRTRAEAIIQLDDRKAALALLDGQLALPDALGVDLLLTRAELRAAAGRFREALADFTQVLELANHLLGEGGDERALYGRAVCLGHLSQDERARVDLLAYQQRFPTGKFAVEVQRLLTGSSPPRP
jgi:tetratricopeptide (TPR) repeat protein